MKMKSIKNPIMMRQAGRLIHHYRVLKLLWIAMLTIEARITRFSELRQHSRDMSSWLYHQQGKSKGVLMTPMLNCSFSVLGISPMTLGAVVLNCFSNITILKIVTAWLICAHVVGICFAVSARLFVPLNKLCPTMQKCYRYSKIILNSNQFLSL